MGKDQTLEEKYEEARGAFRKSRSKKDRDAFIKVRKEYIVQRQETAKKTVVKDKKATKKKK